MIIVKICAKAPYRINRYCLKRVSDVTFSKNNGSDGLNLKTMEMAEGHLEFQHSDLSKYKMISGKVVLHQFLGPFSFEVHFQYDHWWPS